MSKKILITGCRGIPAGHGGFETFAERLALYLVKKDFDVTVYCQDDDKDIKLPPAEDMWKGVKLVHIPVKGCGVFAPFVFDLRCFIDILKREGTVLTLGYDTAVFNLLLRFKKRKSVINPGGIEWKRSKWGVAAQIWLYFNEKIVVWAADRIIADHPEIKKHIIGRGADENRVTMIPYGADVLSGCEEDIISGFGLKPNNYALVIARPEPENQIAEIIRGYTRRSRGMPLVVLGNYSEDNPYHVEVKRAAAGSDVIFPGGIYNRRQVEALRFYASLYIHGHTVGGTNPSLVEALGAGNLVIAHNNPFNGWVAGDAAVYFNDKYNLDEILNELLSDNARIADLKTRARLRHQEAFLWPDVLAAYERILAD